jgi:hypothetical protein
LGGEDRIVPVNAMVAANLSVSLIDPTDPPPAGLAR